VEHDSVVSLVASNGCSIPERVSGSGRLQLYRLDMAPQAYQSIFAANVLGNDSGGSVLWRIQVRVQLGEPTFRAIRRSLDAG
jgi:hypothetical protein